jgi:hypothetical protein
MIFGIQGISSWKEYGILGSVFPLFEIAIVHG